jgi:hypothetical protein
VSVASAGAVAAGGASVRSTTASGTRLQTSSGRCGETASTVTLRSSGRRASVALQTSSPSPARETRPMLL